MGASSHQKDQRKKSRYLLTELRSTLWRSVRTGTRRWFIIVTSDFNTEFLDEQNKIFVVIQLIWTVLSITSNYPVEDYTQQNTQKNPTEYTSLWSTRGLHQHRSCAVALKNVTLQRMWLAGTHIWMRILLLGYVIQNTYG